MGYRRNFKFYDTDIIICQGQNTFAVPKHAQKEAHSCGLRAPYQGYLELPFGINHAVLFKSGSIVIDSIARYCYAYSQRPYGDVGEQVNFMITFNHSRHFLWGNGERGGFNPFKDVHEGVIGEIPECCQ